MDYDASVEELVRRGEFQWVADEWHTSRFNSKNYPTPQTGRAQLQTHLMPYQGVSIQEGLNKLDSTAYRPATLHELLAFGAAHPMLQKDFSIVAPGTQVPPRPDQPLAAPKLGWGGLGRILSLVSMTWNQGGYEWMLLAVSRR
jgi:hypothetical protein